MRKSIFLASALLTALAVAAPSVTAMERQPNADYRQRREKLAAKAADGVVILFASTEEEGESASRAFRQNDDFYYLTGSEEPGAALVIAAKNDTRPYTEVLFLPARNVSQERWTGPKNVAETPGIAAATGFDRVMPLDAMREELVRILPSPRARILTDLDEGRTTPAAVPLAWLRRANAFPNYARFEDVKPLIAGLRMIKDDREIALLRKAASATVEGHLAALKAVRPGVAENEIAAVIEFAYRRRGAEAPAFSSIVGGGLNSTVLHYGANENTLAAGDLVVLDVGSEYSMYASDVTRTVPVSGRFTPRQREIYEIVLGAQQAAVDAFRSGTSTISRTAENSLHKVAADYINTHGKDLNGQPLGQYFIHGLSHFVGLAVHDAGDVAQPLQPGTVFTIEPGIYIPEEKIGVRIEDTYVVTAEGKLDCISCGAPKTVEEIEKAMRR